ncbi:MAG: phosphoenolpyruvate synthase, partial [Deltaproteobacteria bacterium]|nr:phosphoenolpyruvate synthase [Deltaproteobacteria bacterium]
LEAFYQLSGNVGGYPFVKVVIDKQNDKIHFINHSAYPFHADYIADKLLEIVPEVLHQEIDKYNKKFYFDLDRRFYLAILAFHVRENKRFFSLETVEVDRMSREMLEFLYNFVKTWVDPSVPILLKPANHFQEAYFDEMNTQEFPKIFPHELFSQAKFIALNQGFTQGRIRAFLNEPDYASNRNSLEWYDILVMPKVPDDIPRISGIINAEHTTPLSHTNVLATGWQIPNCIQIGVMDFILSKNLNGKWVEYTVKTTASEVDLRPVDPPLKQNLPPPWRATKIELEEPEVQHTTITALDDLRMSDRFRFGTKAANLGELHHILKNGSERLLGFYKINRPPRANLLPYLAASLGVPENANLQDTACDFLRSLVRLPRGIAIPFSIQQKFLESSPKIQQAIGKLKMALELNAPQIDPMCVQLQKMILALRFSNNLRDQIDSKIASHLGGVSSFVVRSSSNAEDLENFSAAGIYESINHVTTADRILESIKRVWASILSPRSVRLRQEVGISLDNVYMGVIVQEEIKSTMGGVLVTTNPANRSDFRNVYINVSLKSAQQVVQGTDLPLQYLLNTVEGGGITLSLGADNKKDISSQDKAELQKLALAGRLFQSHFSPDYTFSTPVDIEWLVNEKEIYILQLRPYAR